MTRLTWDASTANRSSWKGEGPCPFPRIRGFPLPGNRPQCKPHAAAHFQREASRPEALDDVVGLRDHDDFDVPFDVGVREDKVYTVCDLGKARTGTCGLEEVHYAEHEGDPRNGATAGNPLDTDGEGRAHPGHPAGGGKLRLLRDGDRGGVRPGGVPLAGGLLQGLRRGGTPLKGGWVHEKASCMQGDGDEVQL